MSLRMPQSALTRHLRSLIVEDRDESGWPPWSGGILETLARPSVPVAGEPTPQLLDDPVRAASPMSALRLAQLQRRFG